MAKSKTRQSICFKFKSLRFSDKGKPFQSLKTPIRTASKAQSTRENKNIERRSRQKKSDTLFLIWETLTGGSRNDVSFQKTCRTFPDFQLSFSLVCHSPLFLLAGAYNIATRLMLQQACRFSSRRFPETVVQHGQVPHIVNFMDNSENAHKFFRNSVNTHYFFIIPKMPSPV